MAGDWIQIDHELAESPEVLGILERTGEEIGTIIGRLVLLWTLADRQTVDGVLKNVGPRSLGRVCGGNEQFWKAVEEVKWIEFRDGNAVIPRFTSRFGASARKRMLDAKRLKGKRIAAKAATGGRRKSDEKATSLRHSGDESATVERRTGDELATQESESESESHLWGENTPPPPLPDSDETPVSDADAEADSADDPTPEAQTEFIRAWNATEGTVPCRDKQFRGKRLSHFNARVREGPDWDWRAALAKFPLRCTLHDPDGWRPDIEWFMRPDSVKKILEGKYDWSKKPNGAASEIDRQTGRERKYDTDPNAGQW